MLVQVKEESFEAEVLKCQKPVFVLFKSPWCPNCKRMAPVVEELAEKNVDCLKAVSVDISESPELASRYSVLTIPTTIVFVSGKQGQAFPGVVSVEKLREAAGCL